ncbi:MAG TPA: YlbF family regulator [Actinomycetota bacterium]
MDAQATIPPALRAAAEALGASLERSEPVAAFREAKARLDADEQARGMLKYLAEADADLRRRQAEGTLTRADIDRVRATQQEAWSNPVIAGFAEAQQTAIGYLPEINELISELLGWDFAAMAAAPSTC